jgi:uncharacterized phage protein gp47/JayE
LPLARLTLAELQANNEAALAAQFGQTTPLLPRTVLKILAFVWAAAEHILYGFIDFQAKQGIIDTAETAALDRWAAIWGITRKAAAFAAGDVIFTGVDTTDVPAGTIVVRVDGAEFETDALVTIAGGSATATVTALLAGVVPNTEEATILSLSAPIAGIDSSVTVDTGGIAGGTDLESDDDLRGRLLQRIQDPPQGGSETDYEQWALSVSGVTRAWVFPEIQGAGTVGVSFVLDNDPVSIIPNPAKVQEVEDFIDPLRPVTDTVIVFAPTPVDLDIDVDIFPNTAAVRAAITAELEDMVLRDAEPGGIIFVSRINEAISVAEGEENHSLISPTSDVGHAATELAVLGTVTFDDL